MLTINFNQQLDQETFLNFFDLKIGGVDFGASIKKEHPFISKQNYQQYIEDYYKQHSKEMNKNLKEIREKLREVEGSFFDAVEDIFKEDFRNKEYHGALSIFDCNPRYLDKQIFQVYYKRDLLDKLEVVLHETLHFIFFDYCDNNLSDILLDLDKNSGPYWELSEIFNVIVLNLPQFQKILQRPEYMFYPNLKENYIRIKEIWGKNKNLDDFLRESLRYLKK